MEGFVKRLFSLLPMYLLLHPTSMGLGVLGFVSTASAPVTRRQPQQDQQSITFRTTRVSSSLQKIQNENRCRLLKMASINFGKEQQQQQDEDTDGNNNSNNGIHDDDSLDLSGKKANDSQDTVTTTSASFSDPDSVNDINKKQKQQSSTGLSLVPLVFKFVVVLAVKFITDVIVFPPLFIWRFVRLVYRKSIRVILRSGKEAVSKNGKTSKT